MPGWRSPVDLTLRSCARASGALQKGLDRLASSTSGPGALNPFAWITIAADVLAAAIRIQSDPPSAAPVAAAREVAPIAPLRPSPPIPSHTKLVSPEVGNATASAESLQIIVDQDAVFHFFSLPEKGGASAGIAAYDAANARSVIGFHLAETLRRFNVNVSAPTNRAPLAARYTLGESVGTCTWRWMFMPDDLAPAPGEEPPATKMEPDSAQRFAMIDGLFKFGDGEDGFRGAGSGHTAPVTVRGRKELRVTAIGTLSNGFGKFKDHENGLFIYCGTMDASGFRGAVMLRLGDVSGTLQTSEPLPPLQAEQSPEQGVTWLTIRAQALPSTPVVPLPPEDGQPGVICQQEVRLVDLDVSARGARGFECTSAVRQLVGSVTSRIAFDAGIAGGAADDPVPFAVWREFSFVDFLGKPVGGFTAESADGSAVFTDVAGVRGIRFGSTGRILTGTGRFEGMSAEISENTLLVLDPYAGSSVFALRVEDPEGRFFAHGGVWRDIPEAEVLQRK